MVKNILYTVDQRYFDHMLTSIYSLLANNDSNIVIHIIEDHISTFQRKLLDDIYDKYPNIEIKIYTMDLLTSFLDRYHIPKWRGSNIANARLFAHEIIPDIADILYIDSDTIIQDSLNSLLNRKYETPISAVKELKIPTHMESFITQYYNSGILLFNYELWEKEDYTRRIFDCLNNLKTDLIFPDQDIINLAFHEEITTLSPMYNLFPILADFYQYPFLLKKYLDKLKNYYSYEEIIFALQNPKIFHLLSYLYTRPWIQNSIHPFNEVYAQYRRCWDHDFEWQKNSSILCQCEIIPFINLFLKSFLPEDMDTKIKNKIKENVYQKNTNFYDRN